MFRRNKHDETTGRDRELRCSFCGKGPNQVRKLIAGPVAYICDGCVAICVDIIADDARVPTASSDAASGPSGSTKAIQPKEPPRWSSRLRCNLCRMPVLREESLLLDARGLLCLACVADVQAAAATREESKALSPGCEEAAEQSDEADEP
jgi:ClpX C4-type zinc finger